MKINIIVPFTNKTGGIKIILEYANRLKKKGYDVRIYTPMLSYKFDFKGLTGCYKRLRVSIGNIIKRGNKCSWFDNQVEIKLIPIIHELFIRDADICIATAWPTAYDVANFSCEKGEKFYFIQGYEIWSGPVDLVENSYRLPLNHIVIASWLDKLMRDKFNKKDHIYTVFNGIDFEEFQYDSKIRKNPKMITLLYSKLDLKGYKDGIKVFENVKKIYPDIFLTLFGIERGDDIPDYAQFYLNPSSKKLNEIYCESNIFIYPSKGEGWGLTPMEAMACGCVVVGTNTGSIQEIGKHKINCMISDVGDIDKLTEHVIEILNNPSLAQEIRKNGYSTVENFSWKKSVTKMELIFKNYL